MYAKTSSATIKTRVIMGNGLDFLKPFDGFVKKDEAKQRGDDQEKKRGHWLVS
ncbi:hypothetical protein GCM10028803_02030 [Larkinella knui]|uniref:hypothetical protein n=1 Tax=Larkinella knui TaxID=2025310 RepID=UPI001E3B10BC|nr:hypothetical protein [Larkinella knui]